MEEKEQKLFTEFQPVTTQEWEDKIIADLKGKDYERSLVWKTYEGFKCSSLLPRRKSKRTKLSGFTTRRISFCAWH